MQHTSNYDKSNEFARDGELEQPVEALRRSVVVAAVENETRAYSALLGLATITAPRLETQGYSAVAEDLNVPTTQIFGDVAVRATEESPADMKRNGFDLAA